MTRYQENIVYVFSFGVILAVFVMVVEYRQPGYNENIVQSDYQLVTLEGKNLGWVFSTLSLKHIPDRGLGRFYVIIKTEVSEPYWNHSIFSGDIQYRISFWWNSMLIEELEGNYLGALTPSRGRVMYSAISLPSIDHPFDALQSVHGEVMLTVEGAFFNATSDEVIIEGTKEVHLFIIHPLMKMSIFLLMISISGIAIFKRSGPRYRVKNIWEKIKNET